MLWKKRFDFCFNNTTNVTINTTNITKKIDSTNINPHNNINNRTLYFNTDKRKKERKKERKERKEKQQINQDVSFILYNPTLLVLFYLTWKEEIFYRKVSWCSWLSHHFDVVRVPGSNPGGTIFIINKQQQEQEEKNKGKRKKKIKIKKKKINTNLIISFMQVLLTFIFTFL